MERIAEVLGRFQPDAPDEVTAIKRYIEQTYNSGASVRLSGDAIIVTVPSAALANTLRLRINQLRTAAGTKKRIILRID